MYKRKTEDDETNSCTVSKRSKFAAEEEYLKEKVIKYYLMPSLEHLAGVQVAITLWSRGSIKDKIRKLCRERSINCQRCNIYNKYSDLNGLGQEIKNEVLNLMLEVSEFDVTRKILSCLVNAVGQEIFDWIEYQDRYVLEKELSRPEFAVDFLDSLVWTSRGIIDYEETAKMLLSKRRIRTRRNSYYLACTYCLEDDAAASIPNDTGVTYHCKSIDNPKIMVNFWTSVLVPDPILSYDLINEYKCREDEYIFKKLASNKHRNNQTAIKFMWNRLTDEEKSRQVLSVMKYSKTDLRCFFLSQMNEAQQKRVFKAESRNILLCLLDDFLWKDYFLPTMHYVWDVIPSLDFLRVVEDIVEHRMEKQYEDIEEYNRYKAILKELWKSSPKHLKEFVFKYQKGSRGGGIFFGLLCAKNIDLIELMLPDINKKKKAMILSSHRNFQKCYWLIINDQIDVVERFIHDTIFTKKNVRMFKKKLLEAYGCDVVSHFIQNKKWDEVERFLCWVFESDSEKSKFKTKLAYSEVCDGILESIMVKNNEEGFIELENFIQWCASKSAQEVSDLKWKIHEVYFTKVQCKLIEEEKYWLLDKFLNWCFQDNKMQLETYKHGFYSRNAYIDIINLVQNLTEKNDNLRSLEKFLCWCFTRSREFTRFKKWILEPGRDETVGVCIKLLCKGMFKLADEFVYWCCNSSQIKIDRFKNNLMLYDNIERIFSRHEHDAKTLGKVFRWFNPSLKSFVQFKKKFKHFQWLKNSDIAAYLIQNQKWDEADQFLQQTFRSDNERRKFKEKLSESKIRDEIVGSIVANNHEGGFKELENVLKWCASGNEAKVSEFKDKCEYYFRSFFSFDLIIEDNYRVMQQFLNWLFSHDKAQIAAAKHFYGFRNDIKQLVLKLVEKNDQFRSLEKFVGWCFTRNIEITFFKEWILKPVGEGTDEVCIKLLLKGRLELADEFLRWCCDSLQEKIDNFKNQLILFSGVHRVFERFKHDYDMSDKIILWFNPSIEARIQFYKKFCDYIWAWRYGLEPHDTTRPLRLFRI